MASAPDALATPAPGGAAGRPVTALRGVGAALAARLAKLGVTHVADLLFLLPLRYEDRTRLQRIGTLIAGTRAAIEGEIQLTEIAYRGRRQLLTRLSDGSGLLTLRFFYFSASQQQQLARGTRLRCFGEVRRGPLGLEMVHPEYRRLEGEAAALDDTLTPVYPATEGVPQGRLRALVRAALAEAHGAQLPDLLPPSVGLPAGLPSLSQALAYVHAPPREARLEELASGRHPAQRRLAFEELLAHHLALKLRRRALQTDPAPPLADASGLAQRFLASLPFALTRAQARALEEARRDLASRVPMIRLLQGDVGCGKTVVAAAAAAAAAGSGLQAAFMAPTELLAEQHWRNFQAWFAPLGETVALLSGSVPARTRRSALAAIAAGEVRVVVGTQALFQEGIEFAGLALVIVDEQHRFGVQQRLKLSEKGRHAGRLPHQLIMTATPIPRTLAMTAYADLDISVIDELPPGRTPVTTVVVPEERRSEVVARIVEACRAGRQAYWVCPLIDESDELRAQAAEDTAARLTPGVAGRARRAGARQDARRRARCGHARLQGRQAAAAGGHHRDRGRRGRAQRHAHGDRECRAHGTGAAAPAARARRPRQRRQQLRAAVPRAARAARARAPQGDPREQRRLRDRAAGSRAARPRGTARHAADGTRAAARRRSDARCGSAAAGAAVRRAAVAARARAGDRARRALDRRGRALWAGGLKRPTRSELEPA